MLTLTALTDCFKRAIDFKARYVAVRIAIGLNKEEVIINPKDNFEEKLAYYQHAYDESLRHKFAGDQDIRITGFTFGDSYAELESHLEIYEITGNLN